MISFLAEHGCSVKVSCSVMAGAWKELPRVTYIPCLPTGSYVHFDEETQKPEFLRDKQKAFITILCDHIDEDSIVITHDLIYLKSLIGHNETLRDVAQRLPNVRWSH